MQASHVHDKQTTCDVAVRCEHDFQTLVQQRLMQLDRKKGRTVILIMLVMRAQANTLAISPNMRLCISHLLGLHIRYHATKTLAGPQVDSVGTTHAGTVFFVCKG